MVNRRLPFLLQRRLTPKRVGPNARRLNRLAMRALTGLRSTADARQPGSRRGAEGPCLPCRLVHLSDDEELGPLVDAEPHDHQRNERKMRHVADQLHTCVVTEKDRRERPFKSPSARPIPPPTKGPRERVARSRRVSIRASNRDPGRYRRKYLIDMYFANAWGSDWTPIRSPRNRQF